MNTQLETQTEPKRGIDYNVYPPPATSDRKGWAVTIGGEYVKVAPFASRKDAETYAQTEVLKKRTAAEQRDTAQPVFERVTGPVSADDYNAIVETLQATIESLGNQLCNITTAKSVHYKAHDERLAEALKGLIDEVKLGNLNVRKDFSLMNAHAYASKTLHAWKEANQ